MKQKFILALLTALLCSASIKAQNPQGIHGFGLRFGENTGISYNHQLRMDRSLNMLLSFRDHGMQFTAMYTFQSALMGSYVRNLFWYAGAGAHIGWVRQRHQDGFIHFPNSPFIPAPGNNNTEVQYRGGTAFGPDAVLGFFWQARRIPIDLGAEFKPFADLFVRQIDNRVHGDLGVWMHYRF
jgi:hypothetical protein